MSIATRTVLAEQALATIAPRDRRLAGLVIAVSALALAPGLFWGLPTGKAIVGGLRILDGELPYRDFWSMYAPGQFYLVAALFLVFGAHLFVQGAAAILLVALAAGALFVALRRVRLDIVPALTLVSIYVGMYWKPRPEISSYEPAFLLLLLAINRMLRYLHAEGARHVFVAGLLCGIAAWFKHDVAFYVVLGSAIALIIGWVAAPARPSGWAHPARAIGLLVAGSAATAFPVILLVAISVGPDAWRDLIVFPATDFRVVRGEAYPPLLPPLEPIQRWLEDWQNVVRASGMLEWLSVWILGNVPQVVFVAATGWLVAYRRRLAPDAFAAAVLFLCCMPFFWMAAHVQQNTHPYSMAVMSFLVGGVAWPRMPSSRAGYAVRRLLVATLVVYGIGLMLPSALKAAEIPYFWSGHRTLDLPMARGVRVPAQRYEAYQPIVEFIRTHVPENEPIYVGLTRHDAVVISDQTFYYLAGRPVCSRYNELHPGVTNRVEVQQEIVNDINRLHVRCIVLWKFGWRDEVLDRILAVHRASLPELGARLLDDFIQREFEVIDQHGEYMLLWRRGAPRPREGGQASEGAPARTGRTAQSSRDQARPARVTGMSVVQGVIAIVTRNAQRIVESPVIDRLRFPDTVFTPTSPDQIRESLDALVTHADAIDHAARLYEDEASVDLYRHLLAFRVLGPCRYALPQSGPAYLAQYEEEAVYRIRRTEARLRWPQSIFRLEFLGETLELDVWDGNIAAVFLRRQYFFWRGGVSIGPADGDTVFDCGGCLGDTALAFAASVGPSGRVSTIEPIAEQCAVLEENLSRNPRLAQRVELLRYIASDHSGDIVRMVAADAGSRVHPDGSRECTTITLDQFVESRRLGRVDFIKMDVEGSEKRALLGAAKTVASRRPKLAISAYHLYDDLWTVPLLIHRLNPAYRLFLDHYTNHAEESVVYAL